MDEDRGMIQDDGRWITAKDAVKKIITSEDAVSILNYLSNYKLPKSFFILISTCKYVL